MFHYYDHNQRLPVGIVYSFTDDGNQVIAFPVSSLPAAAQTGDCFAGELFFYRKAIPFCITVKGTAEICSGTPFYIRFSVQDLAVQEFSANSFRQATRHIQKKSMAAVH